MIFFSDIYSTPRLTESIENVVPINTTNSSTVNNINSNSSINVNGTPQRHRIDSLTTASTTSLLSSDGLEGVIDNKGRQGNFIFIDNYLQCSNAVSAPSILYV